MEKRDVARLIDYSLLDKDITRDRIKTLCEEARRYNFHAVFVSPIYIPVVIKLLKDSTIKVGTVISFPYGSSLPEVKAYEAKVALEYGAEELDMVMNIGALKSGDYLQVQEEIRAVTNIADMKIVKVIIEMDYLNREEIEKACEAIIEGGAHFVKTRTGVGTQKTTEADIKLLREIVGKRLLIKAAGGIRAFSECVRLIKAGADRIGTSHAIKIMEEEL